MREKKNATLVQLEILFMAFEVRVFDVDIWWAFECFNESFDDINLGEKKTFMTTFFKLADLELMKAEKAPEGIIKYSLQPKASRVKYAIISVMMFAFIMNKFDNF